MSIRNWIIRNWKIIRNWIIAAILLPILGAIILAIIGRVWHYIMLPPHKIYLIGNIEECLTGDIDEISLPDPNIITHSNCQIAGGFIRFIREREERGNGEPQPLQINGVKVEIEIRTDEGDPLNAEQISRDLTNAKDTLLVIGHMSSTRTKKTLPNYLRAKPPIPIILTIETNPHLITPYNLRNQNCPVFRLSATDNEQAIDASDYIISNIDEESPVIWVVEDSINPVYSNYLAFEFIRRVHERRKAVLLYSNISSTPSIETLRALDINCVFFAGCWHRALILIRQIRAFTVSNIEIPIIVLSDACVSQYLIEQGGEDVEGVYLTCPMRASQFYNNEGHEWYGKVAYCVVEELINSADRRFYSIIREEKGVLAAWFRRLIGTHHVEDARLVLNSIMEDIIINRLGITCDNETYYFNQNGIISTARFHIWQIADGTFCDVQ